MKNTNGTVAFVIALLVGIASRSFWIGLVAYAIASAVFAKAPNLVDEILKSIKQAADKETPVPLPANDANKASDTKKANKPAAARKESSSAQRKKGGAEARHPPDARQDEAPSIWQTHRAQVAAQIQPEVVPKIILKEVPMFVKMIISLVLAATAGYVWQSPGAAIGVFLAAFFVALIIESVRIVPQQNAWVVERLGKYHNTLQPGFNLITPFVDRVAYRHSLKEVPLDVPEQVCITKDNTQLAVDGIIYFQVTDPRLASYGTSDYMLAITQLAQTALRSEVGKMELDKTFESRDEINHKVVSVLDEAGRTWGIKVLRYEIKSLTPPESILRAMQAQITAEREKRALIAKSEGVRQEEINLADGQRQAAILASEGQKQAAINKAQGEATALTTVAEATASAVRQVAAALEAPGGMQAANLKVAEQYVQQFGNLAKTNNTLILPANLADAGGFVAAAMTVLDKAKLTQAQKS